MSGSFNTSGFFNTSGSFDMSGFFNISRSFNGSMTNSTTNSTTNTTQNGYCDQVKTFSDCCVQDPQLYYFYRKALNISPSISSLGEGINWKLVGCLILSWAVVYACIVKGVKSSGKVRLFYLFCFLNHS